MGKINTDENTGVFRRGSLRRGQWATLFLVLSLACNRTGACHEDGAHKSDLYQKHKLTLGVVARHEHNERAAENQKNARNDAALEIACLKRAAYSGNSAGADALSQIYAGGFGVPTNPELAYAWSEVAAVEGNIGAKLRRTELLYDLSASQLRAALRKADAILMAIKLPDWNTGPIRGSQKKQSHPGEAVERFIHRKLTACPPWRHPS